MIPLRNHSNLPVLRIFDVYLKYQRHRNDLIDEYRLHAAAELKDMNYPGANLHKLTGDKKDQYAVKISGNWQLFFEFVDGDAYVVDYDDYH